jgi:hypothetical protein
MDEPLRDCPLVAAVEIVAAEFASRRALLEQVIRDHQDRVPDRHRCLLRAAPPREPLRLRRQVTLLRVGGRVRGLHEQCSSPGTALARPAAPAFARALVIAGTHPRPTRAMPHRRKTIPIGAGGPLGSIRDQPFCDPSTDAWDRVEPRHRRLDWQ